MYVRLKPFFTWFCLGLFAFVAVCCMSPLLYVSASEISTPDGQYSVELITNDTENSSESVSDPDISEDVPDVPVSDESSNTSVPSGVDENTNNVLDAGTDPDNSGNENSVDDLDGNVPPSDAESTENIDPDAEQIEDGENSEDTSFPEDESIINENNGNGTIDITEEDISEPDTTEEDIPEDEETVVPDEEIEALPENNDLFFEKDFEDYTVTEGLLLLIFVVLFCSFCINMTTKFLHVRWF